MNCKKVLDMEEEGNNKLHLVVFPWLAMGHLIPFLRLSIVLAEKGHSISFISTTKNLKKLAKIPKRLSSSISLISLPLPSLPGFSAETTSDIPYKDQQLLKKAFDLLQTPLTLFLQSSKPDWVIYDYASHWLPSLTSNLGISSAFFSLFTAATLSFIGPPPMLMKHGDPRSTPEDFTFVPAWIPFESGIKYRVHEVSKYVEKTEEDKTGGPSDPVRFGFASGKADLVIIRSSPELEPEWFELFGKLSEKPVIPIGFLPPLPPPLTEEEDEEWIGMKKWLDEKEAKSVVYVCLGTEAVLTREQVKTLAIGLEKSNSAFFWAVGVESTHMLPDEFEERVKDRGVVYSGWVPQVKILSHESVGVFLSHCGWNSIVEGLSLSKVLILFPVLNDQGLNARLLEGKKLGFEIPRNELNGEFTSDSVADLVNKAKLDDSAAGFAKEKRDLFGDTIRNNRSVDEVVRYLQENRKKA